MVEMQHFMAEVAVVRELQTEGLVLALVIKEL
jgi:hypothetical protein